MEIAKAVLHNPLALFLDEPTVMLDPVARESVWNYVKILSIAAICPPKELELSIGTVGASLNQVFEFYVGKTLEIEDPGENFRDVSSTRRIVKRLG